jgi:DNA mismatch repair ATPase MutL
MQRLHVSECRCYVQQPSQQATSSLLLVRRFTLITFVNGRLVVLASLRRALESLLTGSTRAPFAFVSVRVPATHVDVNMHPTKETVRLVNELDICDALIDVSASPSTLYACAGCRATVD